MQQRLVQPACIWLTKKLTGHAATWAHTLTTFGQRLQVFTRREGKQNFFFYLFTQQELNLIQYYIQLFLKDTKLG